MLAREREAKIGLQSQLDRQTQIIEEAENSYQQSKATIQGQEEDIRLLREKVKELQHQVTSEIQANEELRSSLQESKESLRTVNDQRSNDRERFSRKWSKTMTN